MARLSCSTTLFIVISFTVCLLSQQQVAAAAATAQQQIISQQMPLFAWSSAGGAAADTKHIQSLQVHRWLCCDEGHSVVQATDLSRLLSTGARQLA
jgi:hypothetical protein